LYYIWFSIAIASLKTLLKEVVVVVLSSLVTSLLSRGYNFSPHEKDMSNMDVVFEANKSWVRGYFHKRLGKMQENDIDDLILQSFTYLWTWMQKNPDLSDDFARGHLFTLCQDVLLTYWRDGAQTHTRVEVWCLEDGLMVDHEFLLKEDPFIENEAIVDAVRYGFSCLSLPQRDLIKHIKYEDEPLKDYAIQNHVSYQAVQSRLKKANANLKRFIEGGLWRRGEPLYYNCRDVEKRPTGDSRGRGG
jgi:DNA-directed RNA polymerase specialized sigma24 family protein